MKECYNNLTGIAYLESYEGNLKIELSFIEQGQVLINGNFQEYTSSRNELRFELNSDQSYFNQTISELASIADKYGDMKGVKNV